MEQKIISIRKSCRVCGFKPLTPILSLGDMYVSDFLDPHKDEIPDKFPLELLLCNGSDGGCGLLQLKDTVSHESMYRNYWYRSGINKTMTDELVSIAKRVESLVDFKPGDFVIDIGANDGTLLRGFSKPDLNLTGFEPAKNLAEYNRVGTTLILEDFFNADSWMKVFEDKKAKSITAIAMFYDLEDPNAFIHDVARCLDKEGVFIIQMSYLPLMLSQNAFDNICHEHLEYYSLLSLENLLSRHNLEVFDVELNDVNGGSFRTYIRHQGEGKTLRVSDSANERVAKMREDEKNLGLQNRQIYDDFVSRIQDLKNKLTSFIKDEVSKGKKVYAYGASTKGNTLLQFYGLDNNLITAAAERNPAKWGKRTVGTDIPIISEDEARKAKPDYFLVLPWHFIREFKEREKAFFEGGGKFIMPLPEFQIINGGN